MFGKGCEFLKYNFQPTTQKNFFLKSSKYLKNLPFFPNNRNLIKFKNHEKTTPYKTIFYKTLLYPTSFKIKCKTRELTK